MSQVLLFNHPGREHIPSSVQTIYPWNARPEHRRKFLLVDAELASRVSDSPIFSKEARKREVGLWGEWEPCSTCGLFDNVSDSRLPVAWHRPLLGCTPSPSAQNTDPWVFGWPMRYSNCGQKLSALRNLNAGDLILFGSVKKSRSNVYDFFLDTVFVIDRAEPYSIESMLPNVDHVFGDHVLKRLRHSACSGYMLYDGLMLQDAAGSRIFSWVPCKPFGENPSESRFARPRINRLFGVAFKNPQTRVLKVPEPAPTAWHKVADYCAKLGLDMAAQIGLPTKTCPGIH